MPNFLPLLCCFQACGTCWPESSHSQCSPGRSFKVGGGTRGKVKRWDSHPIPSCEHRASSTDCHSFQGAASSLSSQVPCSHKWEHWLHVGMKQPGGRTMLQDDSMRFWAQFSCFKLEKQAWPHIMEPNSLILVQVAEEHEWFVAGPSFF